MYAVQKFDVIISKKDVDILSSMRDSWFDENFKFTYNKGLNIAVAFTAFDNEREWMLDPSYGSLIINSYTWGVDKDGFNFSERKKLDHHVCSAAELGVSDDETKKGKATFLPPHKTSAGYVSFYQKKFICLEEEDIYLYGDFNTPETR